MSGNPKVYGKVANFGKTFRSGFWVPDESAPAGRVIVGENHGPWPSNIRDSRTWWEGDEAVLHVYWDLLKKCGLNTFSQAARPSHQDRRNRHDIHVIHVIARWKVGVFLAFSEKRAPGSIGPWWMGGKKVMDRLVALPAGRRRVEVAAALCAFIEMAEPSEERGDLPTQAHEFLRRLG